MREILISEVFAAFMIFCRIGGCFMFLPGIGEAFISPRIRLLFALTLTFVLTPVLSPTIPKMPSGAIMLLITIGCEILIGTMYALLVSILFSCLEVAGTIIAFQTGLTAANIFNPAFAQQGSAVGTFLVLFGLVIIFASNFHHHLLGTLVDTYHTLPPGKLPPLDNMAELAVKVAQESFSLGAKLAAPFLLITTLYHLSVGLVNRLMPSLQLFFVALPGQLIIGFVVLTIVLGSIMYLFFDQFEEQVYSLFPKSS